MVVVALDQALVQLLVFLALVADQVAADQAMAEDLLEIKAVMEDQADQEPIKVVAVAVAQVPMVGMDKVLHQTMQDLVAPVLPGMIVLLVLGAAAAVDIRYLLLQHPTLDLEVPAAVEMAPAVMLWVAPMDLLILAEVVVAVRVAQALVAAAAAAFTSCGF